MKQDIFYNRKTALLVMAVMILFACLFGAWKPLHGMRAQALALFWEGGDAGVSIDEDLKTKTGYVDNLVVLANKYNMDSTSLLESVAKVNKGALVDEKIAANQELNKAVKGMYERILENADGLNMSEIDKRAFDSAYNHILSQEDIILRSMNKYNEAVQKYNQELSGFPANLFGAMVGLKRL